MVQTERRNDTILTISNDSLRKLQDVITGGKQQIITGKNTQSVKLSSPQLSVKIFSNDPVDPFSFSGGLAAPPPPRAQHEPDCLCRICH